MCSPSRESVLAVLEALYISDLLFLGNDVL